jgi:Asp-tRNA(Asn)/Glu-tRNA(Gln) amidotransferase A subunit family amidase
MPAGLQIVGRRHCEPQLLQAAAWCESCLDFHERPPLLA